MFYSIAIPGILQAWTGTSINNQIASRSANDNGSAASAHEENGRPKVGKARVPA